MLIDHEEALRRAGEYFANGGKPYTSVMEFHRVAEMIEKAVKETALHCSQICRQYADRAPGGLVPVGAGANASDEIRRIYGLQDAPHGALRSPRSICQMCGGTGVLGLEACPRCGDSV